MVNSFSEKYEKDVLIFTKRLLATHNNSILKWHEVMVIAVSDREVFSKPFNVFVDALVEEINKENNKFNFVKILEQYPEFFSEFYINIVKSQIQYGLTDSLQTLLSVSGFEKNL